MPCFERALQQKRSAVHARHDAVEVSTTVTLRPEPPPHRAQLEADRARADDDQALRHSGKRKRVGRMR